MPTFVAGLFGWMIGYRLLIKFRNTRDEPPAWMLLALSVVDRGAGLRRPRRSASASCSTSRRSACWEPRSTSTISTMIRPGWLVLGAGLIVVAVDLVRARFGKRRKPSRAIPA